LERYFNREKYKIKKITTTTTFFITWGDQKWNDPKTVFLIFFKLDKLVEDYQVLLPSKQLKVDFCCLENVDF
jgi:hypothetical protein